jgi:deoxyribonuclease V
VPPVETLHSWDLSTQEARDLQLELAARVDVTRPLTSFATVAGADISYELRGKWLYAAVVVLRAKTWEVVEQSEAEFPLACPVPGRRVSLIYAEPFSSPSQLLETVPTSTRRC